MVATTEGRLSPIVTGLIYCSVIEACQRYQIVRRASEWTEALSSWCAKQPGLVAFTGRCLVHRSEILLFDGRWPEAEIEAGERSGVWPGVRRRIKRGLLIMRRVSCADCVATTTQRTRAIALLVSWALIRNRDWL